MNIPLIISNIGMPELIIIVFIILLLFGPKKIPELMKGIGKGVSSFKKGMSDIEDELKDIENDINVDLNKDDKK